MMFAPGARASALALLVAAGCDDGARFGPVRLDTSTNCADVVVEVLTDNLDDGTHAWDRTLDVALDEPGRADYWALVEREDQRAVVHVRSGQVDHSVSVASFLPGTTDVELHPGPTLGSAWLVESGLSTFRVWHFEAVAEGTDPLRAVSINLGGFPGSLARLCGEPQPGLDGEPQFEPCDVTDWRRELAFVEGQPFLISTPPFSPNATMYVYAGRLRTDLSITEQTQLEFFRRCESEFVVPFDDACSTEMMATTYPSLVVGGTQQDHSDPVHTQFIIRDRSVDRVPVSRELVGLALDLDENDRLRGFVYSNTLDDISLALGPPSNLATDDVAAYFLHRVEDDGARVTQMRMDAPDDGDSSERFSVLSGLAFDNPPPSLRMLQMPGDIAMGWVEDDRLQVLKLFPAAPSSSGRTTYAPNSAVTSFTSAGRGAYLVFEERGGPDLVQLRCAE